MYARKKMSGECDKCGLDDPECNCYMHELADRIEILEDCLERLNNVVKSILTMD